MKKSANIFMKIFFLFFLQLFILTSGNGIVAAQSTDNLTSKVYLGQPLKEIEQTILIQERKYDTGGNIISCEAFVNPMEQYNLNIKEPISLEFYNGKLSGMSMYSPLTTLAEATKHYRQWCQLIADKYGKPIIVDRKKEDKANATVTAWLSGNTIIMVMYVDLSKLSPLEDMTGLTSISIGFLEKNDAPELK